MTKLIGRLFLTALLAMLTSSAVFAQSGKIAGKVTDQENGEALIGASVLVIGTSLGAATDFDGNYNILNVPPGVYTIRISYVGYTNKTISNVRVATGLTARIDVPLSAEVLTLGEEITITAERPMVQKDQTASTATVSGDQIAALPVTEISQVVSLQAGNVGGHFRGGRSGEVGYMIDGVPVTDKYDGSSPVEVNKSSVSELQVISGAFNAEYGQAMSAIINVSTKDGNNKYEGALGTYFGDYMTGNDDLFPRPSTYNPLNIQSYEGTVSGPIIKDNLYFFFVARYVDFGGYLYGKRKYNVDNVIGTDPVTKDVTFSSLGDNELVQMNNSSKISIQNKLTWPISTSLKSTLNLMYESREWKEYDRGYVYNPDGTLNRFKDSYTAIASLTHTISANTFYTVSLSGFTNFYEHYVYDGLSSKYVDPLANSSKPQFTFSVGGVDMSQFRRETNSYSAKADLWSQVTNEHQIKTGVEYKIHNIDYLSRTVQENINVIDATIKEPYIVPMYASSESSSNDSYVRKPTEFAAYIQDKIEFTNFILNLGVRFDWFDAAGKSPADPTDPNIYLPGKESNRFNDTNGNGKIDLAEQDVNNNRRPISELEKFWWKKSKPKYQFSPRIGAAFPITDRGKIYFSYGHFYQFPNFELLYSNANYKLSQGSGNVGNVGNPDLKPEQNVSMELGLNQQITDNTAIDATLYFRDYRNLSGTASSVISTYIGNTYGKVVNADFAFIRGFILSVNQRMTDGLAITLDYTFQIAKGTASDPYAASNALNSGRKPELTLVPLSWDQTHTVNTTINYSQKDWGVSSIMTFGSGQPYTPRLSQDVSTLSDNSETKPSAVNVDLRGYYNIELPSGSLSLYARIYNLFDTLNEEDVFDDSGRTGYTKDFFTNSKIVNDADLKGINTLKEIYTNPQNYSEPRRLEFGVTYNF
ncbi:MAG: TonB-dependent receptor [Bacteroidetes bacterium]|nr:TonB-dependent receptor [Bacteroidota bacterium]